MATPVEMPKLGNTVEECLVSRWVRKKGDSVGAGEVIAEIETDKATFDLTAPVAGTILETFFGEGSLVPVFANLLVIGAPGEAIEAFRPAPAASAGSVAQAASAEAGAGERGEGGPAPADGKSAGTAAGATEGAEGSMGACSPRARRFAEEHNFHPAGLAGSGPGGRVLEEDIRRAFHESPRVSTTAMQQIQGGAEIRRPGSGAGGMILSSDLGAPGVRVSGIREKIARRMRESLGSTAQYTLNASADARGLLKLRAKIKAARAAGDANINDLITYCAVKALLEAPDLNAEFIGGKLYKHSEVHIGFACDTPRGLMVPVVRDAHELSLGELALRMKELTARAVEGKIAADDLSGGTFTISNLGSLGIESFTPLLNPPQVAILGVGAIALKPVRQGESVGFVDSIGLSLTCDHQVIDGAPGARFLKVLREKIETVERMCPL